MEANREWGDMLLGISNLILFTILKTPDRSVNATHYTLKLDIFFTLFLKLIT